MRSRSDMRRALEEAELRERRAQAGARLLLYRHEGQAIVLFQEPERGQRGLDRARVRLDEVRLHPVQEANFLASGPRPDAGGASGIMIVGCRRHVKEAEVVQWTQRIPA